MVNNSNDINYQQTNNHLSPYIIEHESDHPWEYADVTVEWSFKVQN
jgi:hypothetical protein